MGGGGVMGREGLLLGSATFIYLFIYFWPQKNEEIIFPC